MDDHLKELQHIFFSEGSQLLEDAEHAFLSMDVQANHADAMNKAFRLFHNFKGSSQIAGFGQLSRIAHKAEDILSLINKNTMQVDDLVVGVLLETIDSLRNGLVALYQDPAHELNTASIEAQLDKLRATANKTPQHSQHAAAFMLFNEDSASDINSASPGLPQTDRVSPSPPANPGPTRADLDRKSQIKIHEDAIRVPAPRLDELLNFIGELVVHQAMIDDHRAQGRLAAESASSLIAYMSKLVHDIQGLAMSLRLVSIRPLFQKLNRAARDIASELSKPIEIIIEGEHVELDKTVLEKITDPLIHMVRNSVDHGIETSQERLQLNKPPIARLQLLASQSDDRVIIKVIDDGRGLSRAKIIKKAIEIGIVQPGQVLDDQSVYALIFMPGFSTKENVSSISGRGIGMEVVKRAVDELKGSIQIETAENSGTTFTITLPLTLSLIEAMVVEAGECRYVVPTSQLVETIELGKLRLETFTGKGRVVDLRGDIVPVLSLCQLLSQSESPQFTGSANGKEYRPALVTLHRGRKIAIEVDGLFNQQQTILKHLGKEFSGLPGIVGGAILNNGEPGLILNLHELIDAKESHAG